VGYDQTWGNLYVTCLIWTRSSDFQPVNDY
jgi:hypothetical protein